MTDDEKAEIRQEVDRLVAEQLEPALAERDRRTMEEIRAQGAFVREQWEKTATPDERRQTLEAQVWSAGWDAAYAYVMGPGRADYADVPKALGDIADAKLEAFRKRFGATATTAESRSTTEET